MMDKSNIVRSVFGVHKIKYKILDDLHVGRVNAFHINLQTILNFAYKHYSELSYESEFLYTIVSQIINICAHYRHYFVREGLDPDIYIYSGDCNGRFKDTIRLLKVITQYIPRVYFIKTNDIPVSSAILYISSTKKYKHNLVLTKSKMDVLLVNDKIKVLKSNKDKSILYTPDDVFSKFTKRDYSGNLSWKLLPIFYALTGLSGNQIKGYSPAKVLKLLNKSIDSHKIVNEYYNDITHFLDDIGDDLELNDLSIEVLKDNFKNANIVAKYRKYITPISREMIDNSIIDKFAKDDLKELNMKYFLGPDSLMLTELLEQVNQDSRSIRW